MPQFVGWERPGIYRRVPTNAPVDPHGRAVGTLTVGLADGGPPVSAGAPFLIAGPGDVAHLAAGQITERVPYPGVIDAESTKAAHIEFSDSDLPWRYSPVGNPPVKTGGIRPWLVLVAGSPEEVVVSGSGLVQLSGSHFFAAHDLHQNFQWAHVHDIDGRRHARLICPRDLRSYDGGQQVGGLDWVVALVPGWRVTDGPAGPTLTDSWTPGAGPVTVPLYDAWTFRTDPDPGDFASIASALDPLSTDEIAHLKERNFGRATIAVSSVPGQTQSTGGALTWIPQAGDPPIEGPLDASVATAVTALTTDLSVEGRWVLTLPRYDTPWHAAPVNGEPYSWPPPSDDVAPEGWRRQLRAEPRYRGAAGLGMWNAIAWQDKISDSAAQQSGAVALAAARITHLVAGLQAGIALWEHRMPADPVARLAVLAPMLARLPAAGGGAVLAQAVGRTPALRPALFSSAARRILRRRGPVERASAPGATSLAALIGAANSCPPPQRIPDEDVRAGTQLADPHQAAALSERLAAAFEELVNLPGADQQLLEHLRAELPGLSDPVAVQEAAGLLSRVPHEPVCRPLDLGAFAQSVVASVDPTQHPIAVDVVLSGITGLRPPLLATPETAPEIDLPLWSFLKDNSPDWLLPGAGDLPADRVVAVQTNPVFVDSYLIGANYQTLGELRWRNLSITTRWTPLRRFWQRINADAESVETDITPVVSLATDAPIWTDASMLGASGHTTATNPVSLVIVLHTTLFRRYPTTLIYLTPTVPGATPWQEVPTLDGPAADRRFPIFSGSLTPDLVFFGFDQPPEATKTHWVVLEEPPRGFRFYTLGGLQSLTPVEQAERTAAGQSTPAANATAEIFAAATFARPVRVFLGNL
jgi:hypothetical protein